MPASVCVLEPIFSRPVVLFIVSPRLTIVFVGRALFVCNQTVAFEEIVVGPE